MIGIGLVEQLLLWAGAIAAVILWAWWPLWATGAAVLVAEIWRVLYVPLRALSERDVKRARRMGWALLACFLLLVVIAGAWDISSR